MDTIPKISIVTITRNRAGFIASAIESVQKQSFIDWELLILDDDSNDQTLAIVEAYIAKDSRIKYYKNSPALGISKNRNHGLSKAQGTYIAVLDSDDKWIDENKLKKQFDFLESHPDYSLISSNIKIVDEKDTFIKNTKFKTDNDDIKEEILINNQIPHSAVMYRKDLVLKIAGYDETLSCVEDLDLFLRLGNLGRLKNLKETTTSYTRHSDGVSQKRSLSMALNHLHIVIRNFGKYPNWSVAFIVATLRIVKNLF